ncbi:MAG: TetR/AcrR family transcriptional regulator [Nocardioides sp.]|uniref:TetR/AcrR family transcriptional regulator n=1 Tax=Nocardioides sp. TaxID=35761 RepID=UPI003EFD8181
MDAPTTPATDERPRSNQRHFSALTRASLVDVAQDLFSQQGYAATSLDAIVSGADVTKGALYHHFSSKQALFEAVFERLEQAAAEQVSEAMSGITEPWEMAQAGLRAFLDVLQSPLYRRVVMQDGPSVLGTDRFRQEEERSTFGIVVGIIHSVLAAGPGTWEIDDEMIDTFGRIFYGALSAAGISIAASDEPEAAAKRAEAAVAFILLGLRELAEKEETLPDHRI